jgi:hypothetical protein
MQHKLDARRAGRLAWERHAYDSDYTGEEQEAFWEWFDEDLSADEAAPYCAEGGDAAYRDLERLFSEGWSRARDRSLRVRDESTFGFAGDELR